MTTPSTSRVLVTGADGKVGRVVVADLRARGVKVTGLSPAWSGASSPDERVTGDATVEADVARALAGVDAVVHLAALPHPNAGSPYAVYRTNTDATFNVLSAAGTRGIARAVIASSINAFGVPMHSRDRLPAYFPIDEQIPAEIDDWYSLSKRSDELTAAMAASRWGMAIVALRFPYVGSPAEVREYADEQTSQQLREGWSYIDTRDAVAAIWSALTSPLSPGAHVVGLSAADTYREEATADLLERYAPSVPVRTRPQGRSALIDTTLARTLLGFAPRFSIADSLAGAEREPSVQKVRS